MSSWSWNKVTGWAGVLFVLIFVVSSAPVAGSPTLGAAASDVRAWLQDSQGSIALTTWGGSLSLAILLLLFASGLRGFLAPAEENQQGIWSRVSFAGAVIMAALGISKALFWAVLSLDEVLASATDETLQVLHAFDGVAVSALVPWGTSALLLGASIVIVQTSVMARWLGWLGLFTTLVFGIGTLWLFTGDYQGFLGGLTLVGYLGFLIWSMATGISLIRAPTRLGRSSR